MRARTTTKATGDNPELIAETTEFSAARGFRGWARLRAALEVLNRALMFFGCCAGFERPQIAALSRLWIFFA
jgi:hypothetical protein